MTVTNQLVFDDLPKGWQNYQDLLVNALRPLTAEQLALRAAPEQRTIGMIAEHIVGARARWVTGVLHEGDAALEAMATYDRTSPGGRSGREIADSLQASWVPLKAGLARWTPADYAETLTGERRGTPYSFTRGWVVWHLIEHDLHHGGEISLLIGMHGLPAVDI